MKILKQIKQKPQTRDYRGHYRNQNEELVVTGTLCHYSNLSDFDLKKAMLAALGDLANLRADSKSLRRRLESTRSALAEVHHRMSLIKQAWDESDSPQLAVEEFRWIEDEVSG